MMINLKKSEILTFYSYKGGVGRSMAMANVAELLYRQGKKVVMIDWDLEAPGLEGYFFEGREELDAITSQPGLIDMLEAYKTSYARLAGLISSGPKKLPLTRETIIEKTISQLTSQISDDADETFGKISDILNTSPDYVVQDHLVTELTDQFKKYLSRNDFNASKVYTALDTMLMETGGSRKKDIQEVYKENLPSFLPLLQQVRKSAEKEKGELWLLSAGKRNGENFQEYVKHVQRFDWAGFYEHYNGEAYFDWMRGELKSFAEIILIDCRTGVTEMGGVCTRQLSDSVVLLTAPNAQNMNGIAEMIKSFTRPDVIEARKRKLPVIVVPSRIDNSELQNLNIFKANFLQKIGLALGEESARNFWELGIPYVPYYTYHDQLVAGALLENAESLINSRKSAELEKAFLKIASYIVGVKLEPQPEKPVVNPFQQAEDNKEGKPELFVDRKKALNDVLNGLEKNGFVVLDGPAGSGKTSLLNAVVLPALRQNQTVAFYKARESSELLSLRKAGSTTSVIVLDGVDELNRTERQEMVKMLTELKKENNALGIILSTRPNSANEIIASAGELGFYPSRVSLNPFNEEEARQFIFMFASKGGLVFEAGLTDRIINDNKESGFQLLVLQALLSDLWKNRNGSTLTHEAYDRIGRTEKVISSVMKEKLEKIPKEERENAMPVLTRMVTVDSGRSTSVKMSVFNENDLKKLEPFINMNFVNISERQGIKFIELPFEGILESWDELQNWVVANRNFLSYRELINRFLEDYKMYNMSKELLLSPQQLAELRTFDEKYHDWWSEEEKAYLVKSKKEEKVKARNKYLNYALLIAAACSGFLVTPVTAMYDDWQQRKEFNQQLGLLASVPDNEKAVAICTLSGFDYKGNSPVIMHQLDSLKRACDSIGRANQNSEIITRADSTIEVLSGDIVNQQKSFITAEELDKREQELAVLTQKIQQENDILKKGLLKKDSMQKVTVIQKIVKSDTLLKLAYVQSMKIDSVVKSHGSWTATFNSDHVNTQSGWFKEGYFLSFDNLRITLLKLNKNKNYIMVQICEADKNDSCKVFKEAEKVLQEQDLTFIRGANKYVLHLERIASAGYNPFKPAAYVTLTRYLPVAK